MREVSAQRYDEIEYRVRDSELFKGGLKLLEPEEMKARLAALGEELGIPLNELHAFVAQKIFEWSKAMQFRRFTDPLGIRPHTEH